MSEPFRPAVLHVAQPADSGVTNVASSLVADQAARGWRVSVAAPAESELTDSAKALGVDWRRWEAGRAPGPQVVSEARRLGAIAAATAPDIVHLHSAKAGLAGRLALRGRVATVFQPHAWSFEAVTGPVRTATVLWERVGARWADRIVCVSADERQRALDVGIQGPLVDIPNGIDLERYTPADEADRRAARAELGLGTEPLAVLLGRLFHQKGQDTMLAAWPRVRAEVPGAELLLIGDGPERDALEGAAGPGVRFEGAAADVRPWLAAADVVVLPSRWEAGLTLAAMEAMASARSVVTTDVAGSRDGLPADAGAIVGIDAVEPLADAVTRRLADPELARREGLAGRRRVEERYSLAMQTERVASLYAEVLSGRLRGSGVA